MIRGVKFVTIPTRDQDRALAFWTERMGFTVATDQPFGGGQRWIELRVPRADTQVVLFTSPGHEDRVGTWSPFTFWTDDLDATYAELTAAGVETLGPPEKAPWGSSLKFRDPDGNTFLVSSR
ncbi:lactoylglutathione lyase [Gemmatimonadetes bacterium T265]|nr:lactoylglutathione lyase [Gemmatimonadetes bacterium T265]